MNARCFFSGGVAAALWRSLMFFAMTLHREEKR
jgi:hypothetical protein